MRRVYQNHILRGSLKNPFQADVQVGTRYVEAFQFEPAVVVDVITNDEHPDYTADGYNVGVVKFRFIDSQEHASETSLNFAFPIESNVSQYPLLNEIVLVVEGLNRHYYTNIFNTSNRVTAHALFGIKEDLAELESPAQRSQNYDENAAGGAPMPDNSEASEDRLGNDFVDKADVYRLRHQEGDIIIEGRSGHSIRFGSNQEREQAPNVLIRVGPNPVAERSVETPFGLIDEDINLDLSSIWMVTDQIVPLEFATVRDDSHFKSMERPPSSLEGNQILINTDRLVVNTKRDKLLVSTFFGTHFTTLQDHTVDAAKNYKSFVNLNRELTTGENYLITVGTSYLLEVGQNKTTNVEGRTHHISTRTHSIVAEKIFIGRLADESEPLVLGEELRKLLLEFVDAHLNNAASHVIPTIGIGPLAPGTVSALQRIRTKLTSAKTAPFESRVNFVTKTNSAS
jgi:hypothetical protein